MSLSLGIMKDFAPTWKKNNLYILQMLDNHYIEHDAPLPPILPSRSRVPPWFCRLCSENKYRATADICTQPSLSRTRTAFLRKEYDDMCICIINICLLYTILILLIEIISLTTPFTLGCEVSVEARSAENALKIFPRVIFFFESRWCATSYKWYKSQPICQFD